MLVRIHEDSQCLLPLAINAIGAPAFFLRAGKRGKKQRGENCDNGNNDEQLDQCERAASSRFPAVMYSPFCST